MLSGGVLIEKTFPADLDTTSLQLVVLPHSDPSVAHLLMDEMLDYRNSDGSIMVSLRVIINLLSQFMIEFTDLLREKSPSD